MFERRVGGPPHWKEATQFSCITRSVSGPNCNADVTASP